MNRRGFLTLGTQHAANNSQYAKPSVPRGKYVTRNATLNAQQEASRFLAQATLGANTDQITDVVNNGYETWIDTQFTLPKTETLTYMWDVINAVYQVEDIPLLSTPPFRWAWWQAVMVNPDQLRQRVAMALSEIMVISTKTDLLEDFSTAVAYFYDLLLTHAFGNFRDLLYAVTLSPAMGYYLSHAGNRKADPATNRFPDENFAREVMQLFSIGLFELNLDGTHQVDGNGDSIPTYTNSDISEFAKVFTGLTYTVSALWAEEEIDPNTSAGFAEAPMEWDNTSAPLEMYDQFHEPGAKQLLNGFTIPAGQTGMQDINDAIDNLFNHPNVGPFIGRLLIQRMVKSNPSPAYIARVATAFNDNGSGVRGDMQAVVKAILLDDEARNPTFINDPENGMLREPFVRYTHLCRAFEAFNEEGENLFYNSGESAAEVLGQYPFASPSVFNFFSPDYRPLGPLDSQGLVAPEFQIMTSVTAVTLSNFWDLAVFDWLMEVPEGLEPDDPPGTMMPAVSPVLLDLDPYWQMEGDVNALIDAFDLLLTYGTLSAEMRTIIHTALSGLDDDWDEVIRFAIILFLNCPEYAILK